METPVNAPRDIFPYRLRMVHEGLAGLRLETAARVLRVDPASPVAPQEAVILTSSDPERVRHARGLGADTPLIAPAPLLERLSPADGRQAPTMLDGLQLELVPYTPCADWLSRVQGSLTRPDRAAARLLARARVPRCPPHVLLLTLGSGERLVHLNLSLHSETPADWLAALQERVRGAEWLLLGVPYGEGEAVLRHLKGFEARHVLFVDLAAETRRHLGRPTELLTPTADQAISQGIDGHVFVSQASYRFE